MMVDKVKVKDYVAQKSVNNMLSQLLVYGTSRRI